MARGCGAYGGGVARWWHCAVARLAWDDARCGVAGVDGHI